MPRKKPESEEEALANIADELGEEAFADADLEELATLTDEERMLLAPEERRSDGTPLQCMGFLEDIFDEEEGGMI